MDMVRFDHDTVVYYHGSLPAQHGYYRIAGLDLDTDRFELASVGGTGRLQCVGRQSVTFLASDNEALVERLGIYPLGQTKPEVMSPTAYRALYWKAVQVHPDSSYGSDASLFGDALRSGTITQSEYEAVRTYKGRLWAYAGD